MENIFESILEKEDEPDTCKGLFWRGKTSAYFDHTSGNMVATKRLQLLKRKSCKGCAQCEYIKDYLAEDIDCQGGDFAADMLKDIEHGGLYTYKENSSQDWESGIWEVDNIEFIKVEEK